ncbi:cleavage and polyadenylation specificity factor73-I [Striga asiatica]|uniref:Cleavage and polyadenylation specificity factor73-I n=1 Tax=Striga asiatica TaxID=4170 RepID=A0A5A7QBA4_STRAF|nr:cleavage and polyadenylation specificity factor73-I [Striga asiatica]
MSKGIPALQLHMNLNFQNLGMGKGIHEKGVVVLRESGECVAARRAATSLPTSTCGCFTSRVDDVHLIALRLPSSSTSNCNSVCPNSTRGERRHHSRRVPALS